MALSVETHALLEVLHGVDILAWQNTGIMQRKPRGHAPERIESPPLAAEAKERQRKADDRRARYLANSSRRKAAKRA